MLSIPSIGDLSQDPDVDEWQASLPIPIPFFSGKPLRFVLTLDPIEGSYPSDTETAITCFLKLGESARNAASEAVYKNYRDTIDALGGDELPVADPGGIWDFVTPYEIFVERRKRGDRDVYLVITCGCAWEVEHGLQLVFRRGEKLTRVSDSDGHLTHADAYGLPE